MRWAQHFRRPQSSVNSVKWLLLKRLVSIHASSTTHRPSVEQQVFIVIFMIVIFLLWAAGTVSMYCLNCHHYSVPANACSFICSEGEHTNAVVTCHFGLIQHKCEVPDAPQTLIKAESLRAAVLQVTISCPKVGLSTNFTINSTQSLPVRTRPKVFTIYMVHLLGCIHWLTCKPTQTNKQTHSVLLMWKHFLPSCSCADLCWCLLRSLLLTNMSVFPLLSSTNISLFVTKT